MIDELTSGSVLVFVRIFFIRQSFLQEIRPWQNANLPYQLPPDTDWTCRGLMPLL
ncbi:MULTISPECIES: hypothetical protein [unclassified Marinovum]